MAKLRETAHTKKVLLKWLKKRRNTFYGSKIHHNPYKHKNKMKPPFYLRYKEKMLGGLFL